MMAVDDLMILNDIIADLPEDSNFTVLTHDGQMMTRDIIRKILDRNYKKQSVENSMRTYKK